MGTAMDLGKCQQCDEPLPACCDVCGEPIAYDGLVHADRIIQEAEEKARQIIRDAELRSDRIRRALDGPKSELSISPADVGSELSDAEARALLDEWDEASPYLRALPQTQSKLRRAAEAGLPAAVSLFAEELLRAGKRSEARALLLRASEAGDSMAAESLRRLGLS